MMELSVRRWLNVMLVGFLWASVACVDAQSPPSTSTTPTTPTPPIPTPPSNHTNHDPKMWTPNSQSVWMVGGRYLVAWNGTFRLKHGLYYNNYTRLTFELYRQRPLIKDKRIGVIVADYPMKLGQFVWTVPSMLVDVEKPGARRQNVTIGSHREGSYYMRVYPSYFDWKDGGCEKCAEDIPRTDYFTIKPSNCAGECLANVEPSLPEDRIVHIPNITDPYGSVNGVSGIAGTISPPVYNSEESLAAMRSVGIAVGITAFFAFVIAIFVYTKKGQKSWRAYQSRRDSNMYKQRKSTTGTTTSFHDPQSGSPSGGGMAAGMRVHGDSSAGEPPALAALSGGGFQQHQNKKQKLMRTDSGGGAGLTVAAAGAPVTAPSPLRNCVVLSPNSSVEYGTKQDDDDESEEESADLGEMPLRKSFETTRSATAIPQHSSLPKLSVPKNNQPSSPSANTNNVSRTEYFPTNSRYASLTGSPSLLPRSSSAASGMTTPPNSVASSSGKTTPESMSSSINTSTAILVGNTFRNALRIASGFSEDGKEVQVRGTPPEIRQQQLEEEDEDEEREDPPIASAIAQEQLEVLTNASTSTGKSPVLSNLGWVEEQQQQQQQQQQRRLH